jgi:hypothetical protein
MRRGGKALVLALVLAAGGVAGAQEEEEDARSEDSEPSADARPAPPDRSHEGTYQGVAPGDGAPVARRPRPGRNPRVTWLGFQPQPDRGARVFVQLDREVAHPQQVVDGALIISLAGARVSHSNSRRALDTRFFDTAIDRVAIEPARRRPGSRRAARGLELVIRFKKPAEARELEASMRPGKDGFTYLMVDVPRPAGTALEAK